MLLQFSCSNYKSIKDKIVFSMRASSDSTMLERTKVYNGAHILRIAAIYGANGSGKSNFISAIAFVQSLIVNSVKNQPGELIFIRTHKLSSEDTPSSFDFQFVIDDVRYAYGFSILRGEIAEEYLYHFPNQKQSKIFEREGMNATFGRSYKNSFGLARDALKENRLFLSCAANFSTVEEVEKVFVFFRNTVVLYKTEIGQPDSGDWMEKSIDLMNENPKVKKIFLQVLKYLGTGAKDVETRLEPVDLDKMKDSLPEPIWKILRSGKEHTVTSMKVQIVYDKFKTDLMSEESTGIKKLFQIICPIIDILSSGRILICDELETGLHENIVSQLIKLFYANAPEKFAQLIFTTHDTNLLDLELFRRDQIWFTELNGERATDLYSLVEIRNVRKNENVAARYIEGKYGAIPILNEQVANDLIGSM